MKDEYKIVLEKTLWTFVQAFLGALTVAPLVGVDINTVQLAAISGASASLVVIKEFAKKQLAVVEKKVSK